MNNLKYNVKKCIGENKVIIMFIILCIAAIYTSKSPLTFVANELFVRIGRNGFIVLALIIPVIAGMGLNFGITIGAVAAQIAVFWVVYWGFGGIAGFLLCILISTPLAILFGYLTGKLFNKMKGSEMIAGMVLGYFVDGLYQLLFLFVIGGIIPVNNPKLIIDGGIGVKNTIDLAGNLKYSLDDLGRLNFIYVLYIFAAVVIVLQGWQMYKKKIVDKDPSFPYKKSISVIIGILVAVALTFIPTIKNIFVFVNIPIATFACIAILCAFNGLILKTRLGQNMRTVGQSRVVANAAGINVDKTRIIAMIISTVLACWGQLIYLQNIGTFQTYGAHTQVAQFAIAALLVGGASVQKASSKNAIIGVILFHTLFIVAPQAGKQLFDNAQLGEYFRVFVSYGVIAVSLAMHAWKTVIKKNSNKGNGDVKDGKLQPVSE